MFLTNPIFTGPIRFVFLGLFFFFFNKYVIKYTFEKDVIDYMVTRYSKYLSFLVVGIFFLVQFNCYDIYACLLVLVVLFVYKFLSLDGKTNIKEHLIKQKLALLLFLLKKQEGKESTLITYDNKKTRIERLPLVLVILVACIAFLNRTFLYKYDLYSLSQAWVNDLNVLNALNDQQWISNNLSIVGGYSIISIYSKLVGVNLEMAIQSFSLLESSFISVVIYWFTTKLTGSKIIAPLISGLTFALLYFLIPINVHFITQNNKMLLALVIAIPYFVFLATPEKNNENGKKIVVYRIFFFISMFLINLFTALILIPLYMLVVFVFTQKENLNKVIRNVISYLVALFVFAGVYGIGCYIHNINIYDLFYSNLISLTSFQYTPYLVMPYDKLIVIYQAVSILSIFFLIYFARVKRHVINRPLLIFLIYFNVLVGLGYLSNVTSIWFIDFDLISQSMIVFISVVLGVSVVTIGNGLIKIENKKKTIRYVSALILIVFLGLFYFNTKNDFLEKNIAANRSELTLLDAYYEISETFLPYSYAVVNDYKFQPISNDKHYFINYDEFLSTYLNRDFVYFEHKDDDDFLRENPQIILPSTILLFMKVEEKEAYKHEEVPNNSPEEVRDHGSTKQNKSRHSDLNNIINTLKRRGREIKLFYATEHVKVYEIINQPKSSKVLELIF